VICKSWGVAGQVADHGESSVVSAERLYPGTLVAPRDAGDRPLRADLEDMGPSRLERSFSARFAPGDVGFRHRSAFQLLRALRMAGDGRSLARRRLRGGLR
jgi:hypothetical protein